MSILALGVTASVLFAAYIAWLAARLTRLHQRVVAAETVLEAARLDRARAAAVLVEQLRGYQRQEPFAQAADLAEAIVGCVTAPREHRVRAENELTRALRTVRSDDIQETAAWGVVAAKHRKLEVARQMYNDAVRDTVVLRGRRLPRALRLAAPQARPKYFDINTDLS